MNERFAPLSPKFQPMLFAAASFSLGIVGIRYLNVSLWVLFGLTIGFFLLGVFGFVAGQSPAGYSSQPATGGALLLGIALAGGLLFQIERADVAPNRLQRLYQQALIVPDEPVEVIGRLARPPEKAPQRFYLDLSVERIKTFGIEHPASGRARLMLQLADESARRRYQQLNLNYGDRVRVLTFLSRRRRYRNPGSPDYTEYLDQRGYDVSGVLKSPRLITVLARRRGRPLLARLYELRGRAQAAIEGIFSGQTAAILQALLLGNRRFVSREMAERFRTGGTFHLLVISGMHVGFLSAILLALLSAISGNRWLRFVLIGGALWMYALMIGLDQAPVVRAATMITIALAAPILFRPAPAANTVGLAAFILLVIEPSDLFAPGFQLTFLAVIWLVLLALPLISRLQAIGRWRPSAETPRPPRCPDWIRWLAETMYWDQRGFERELKSSAIRFQLDKARFARALSRWPGLQPIVRLGCLSFIVSTAVQIGLLPAMILYFHRVALGGVVLNISVSILTALFVISGLATFAVAQISLTWAPPLAATTEWFLQAMKANMTPLLQFQWASFRVPEYAGWAGMAYGLYFLPLTALAYELYRWRPLMISTVTSQVPHQPSGTSQGRRRPVRLHRAALTVLFLFSFFLIATHPDGALHRQGWFTISFLDVDQGDAALVEFPRGTTMLVDSGGRGSFGSPSRRVEEPDFVEDTLTVGEAVVSNFLWARGLDRLDYLVPTHADADHIKGFTDVLKNFSVGRALLARAPAGDPEFERFERARADAGVPLQLIGAGDQLEIEGVSIDVLWPPRHSQAEAWANDQSVVMRMNYGRRSVLLTGDIGQTVEHALVMSGRDLRSDVLKVPHHGSRTSSTEAFLRRVQPSAAVISVGEHSRFGHPHPEVIERYRSLGAKILQTGLRGTVTVSTDGERLEISTFVHAEPTN